MNHPVYLPINRNWGIYSVFNNCKYGMQFKVIVLLTIVIALLVTILPNNILLPGIQQIEKTKISITTDNANYDHDYNIINDNYKFTMLTREFIIDHLANKTILLFGDSLTKVLATYIFHTLLCSIDNERNAPFEACHTFCNHLNTNNIVKVLDECSTTLIQDPHKVNLGKAALLFDKHNGKFDRNNISSIYFQKHNITIYVYYKWGTDVKNADYLIDDYINSVKNIHFDIVINNLLSMHIPHQYPKRNGWNNALSMQMLGNLEHYMQRLVTISEEHAINCLIFGPVNPVFDENNLRCNIWSSMQRKLFQIDINKKMSSGIISFISHIQQNKYQFKWENHLNHSLWKELNISMLSESEISNIQECVNSVLHVPYDIFIANNVTNDFLTNYCLLYGCELGNTLFQHRMKDFVKYLKNKSNVYFHDQYNLYYKLFGNNLKTYGKACHYPALQPLAWTNILNIINKGC
eukprot:383416_1